MSDVAIAVLPWRRCGRVRGDVHRIRRREGPQRPLPPGSPVDRLRKGSGGQDAGQRASGKSLQHIRRAGLDRQAPPGQRVADSVRSSRSASRRGA